MANDDWTFWERRLAEALQERAQREIDALEAEPFEGLSPEKMAEQQDKLMERLRAHTARTPPAGAPIAQWREAGRHWLRATRAGLEQLARAFEPMPAPLGARARAAAPEPPDVAAAQTWVPVALEAEGAAAQLTLKCRAAPPAHAPAVALHLDERALEAGECEVDYLPEDGLLHLRFQPRADLTEATCAVGVADVAGEPLAVRVRTLEPGRAARDTG